MNNESDNGTETSIQQAHPWHGVDAHVRGFALTVYIENTPFEVLKYETDRISGLLKIDQPLQTSALPPCAYGFVPRTLCGDQVARLAERPQGDRGALDVFVLSERPVNVAGVLADVRLVGGVAVRDQTLIDDKLIGVLCRDGSFGNVEDIADVPIHLIERICHFLAQSALDGSTELGAPFDRARAKRLLDAAIADYQDEYE